MKDTKIFFLSIFLAAFFLLLTNAQTSKAKTYDECYNEYSACYNSVPADGDTTECDNALSACESSATDTNTYDQFGTDCSSRPGTVAENGECVVVDSNGYTESTCKTQPNAEWVNNECVDKVATDCSQYAGTVADSSGQCVPASSEAECTQLKGYWNGGCYESKDDFCQQTEGASFTWSTVSGKCVGGGGAECNPQTADICQNGCTCKPDSSSSLGGTCQQSTWGSMTGSCKATSSTGTKSSNTNSNVVATTTSSSTIRTVSGTTVQVPSGSQILANGSVVDSSGNQIAPAGSLQLPSTSTLDNGSGFNLCANGMLATVCQGGIGSGISLSPSVSVGGSSSLPGGYTTSSVNGLAGAKCGTNFTEIGGVCFPANTGLSSAPVYVILSNLFSWLMGLFTTFSVLAFVVSGIQYLTSSASEDQAKAAKKNATYALIGIIVGLSGFVIIKAIAAALAGQGYFF